MRLPYIPDPPAFTNDDDKAVVERVRQRRGDKGLIALDRTLLHAPPVADGWYVNFSLCLLRIYYIHGERMSLLW